MNRDMSFREAVALAESIISRCEKIEGRAWGAEGAVIELSKQVGELSRLVMAMEGYYFPQRGKLDKQYQASREKIGDELADVLYAVIRIARHYQIDLLAAHLKARKGEDASLRRMGG